MEKQRCSQIQQNFLFKCLVDYKCLSYGQVVVQDKATKKIAPVVSFTPFQNMSKKDCSEFKELTSMFVEVYERTSNITRNGAHQGGGGIMIAIG